jgi:hypothetical protein
VREWCDEKLRDGPPLDLHASFASIRHLALSYTHRLANKETRTHFDYDSYVERYYHREDRFNDLLSIRLLLDPDNIKEKKKGTVILRSQDGSDVSDPCQVLDSDTGREKKGKITVFSRERTDPPSDDLGPDEIKKRNKGKMILVSREGTDVTSPMNPWFTLRNEIEDINGNVEFMKKE